MKHVRTSRVFVPLGAGPPLTAASVFEAMEARALQRTQRKKEIEELKRKKEEEKLVRDLPQDSFAGLAACCCCCCEIIIIKRKKRCLFRLR